MNAEPDTPPAHEARVVRARPGWRTAALVAALLFLLLGAALAVLVATPAGARFALRAASAATQGGVQAAGVDGTLLGPLTLRGLRYVDPGAGVDLAVGELRLDLAGRSLLRGRVHLATLELRGVAVRLTTPADPPDDEPFSLEPPVDLQVDRLHVEDVLIERDGEPLLEITNATAQFAWTDAGLDLRRLDLAAPQGELRLAAEARQAGERVTGEGRGRFRWQAGSQRLAGTLEAQGDADRAWLHLTLAEPMAADLRVELQQTADLAWRFALQVPAFDPRRALLPDTSISRLAARLEGQGDRDGGSTTGTIEVDELRVELRPVSIQRRGDEAVVDATLLSGAGRLHVAGDVRPTLSPVAADLELAWQDIVLPVALAGQALRTEGQARFSGSTERYAATAQGRLGPPRRMAAVTLELDGDATRVELRRLEVEQAAGRLAARGTIGFGEELRWQLESDARDFDPGAFLAEWPGRLSFSLRSDGRLREPSDATARLRIDALRGRLRGRAVSGRGDVALAPGLQLSGDLDLRSGASRVRLEARRGEQLDATLRADVPDLQDWLPAARGRLSARATASGRWPDLRIEGDADGRALAFGEASVGGVELRFDLTRPLDPRGQVSLLARELQTAGVQASRLELALDGEAAAHQVDFRMQGSPLSAQLRLEGALSQGDSWRGEVQQLGIDAPEVAQLALVSAAQVAWNASSGDFEVSPACLADGPVEVCIEGRGRIGGPLQASYSVQRLPLALAALAATTPLPVAIDGELAGRGELRIDARGLLEGQAEIGVARGRISLADADDPDEPQRLLDFADLRLEVAFADREARAVLAARLDGRGGLDGTLRLSDLGTATVQLDGRLRATLPSLAVVGAFTPQLAEVDGNLSVELDIGGSLEQPRLEGELRVADLRADVPELGIELRAGQLRAVPRPEGRIDVDGAIRSGDGALRVAGEVRADGQGKIRVAGQDFLAVDRPGTRVVVAPDLEIVGDPARLEVSGKLVVPTARIDLQRLPRGDRAPSASPDVVVIDDAEPGAANGAALPLFGNVEVTLGDDVDLAGFGLDAQVTGSLRLQERPGQATTAAGEIRVAGTYQAYGQDLTIREGRLLYAGTPIDDPRLNIVAVRVVDAVTAGLRVTGSARAPQLDVFSDPAMGQAGALAYLIAGKPLEAIGQADPESDALESAARSLGTAAGGLLARSIGRRIGVDVLGIEDSDALGGAALTIGQYLSPRVFISYGVGLFDPGEVITLSYRLAQSLAVEVESATESSRFGVEYRTER